MNLHYLGYCPYRHHQDNAYLLSDKSLEELQKKHVVIFGAGEIGSYAIRFLCDKGVRVRAFCSTTQTCGAIDINQ